MQISMVEQHNVQILELQGRLDAVSSQGFEEVCHKALLAPGTTVIVDLKNLDFISSAGLRGILSFVKICQGAGKKLLFCSLQPLVADVFRISGLSSILAIHADVQSALAALEE